MFHSFHDQEIELNFLNSNVQKQGIAKPNETEKEKGTRKKIT